MSIAITTARTHPFSAAPRASVTDMCDMRSDAGQALRSVLRLRLLLLPCSYHTMLPAPAHNCCHGMASLCRECGNVYKKEKDMDKGIAFPTCLSVDQYAFPQRAA